MDATVELQLPGATPDRRAVAADVVSSAYLAFGPEILARLRGLVRDEHAAEDLAQETFLRLHSEMLAGPGPTNVRAWLHCVAGNLATSRGRRSQVAARWAPRLAGRDEASSTEEIVLRREYDGRLRAVLGALRPIDREVLLLAAAGLSGPEIAARLGRTQVATRTLLCRARSRLREGLASGEAVA